MNKILFVPIDAKKILEESGGWALAKALENGKASRDIYLSRAIGIAYIKALANLCKDDEPLCDYYLRLFAHLYEKSLAENKKLIELIVKWREVREILESKMRNEVYDYGHFALAAATDWLVPCDWDHESSNEWTESDIDECSSGAAERVLGCFFETYIRLQSSVKIAKKIAEAAIQEERKWRVGTKTEFRLVEDAVLNVTEEHIYELGKDDGVKKSFDKLITSIAQQQIGEVK